jgi:3-dehydroquinate synthase
MKTTTLCAPSGICRIMVGEHMASARRYIGSRKIAVVTDSNVRKEYERSFPKGCEIIEMEPGERNKTVATVRKIYNRLSRIKADRDCFVLGIGGGVVTDVAGYAAATYKRGLDVGFIPTTLVAQVDAAIGGKNGVNVDGYKNQVGTIKQPKFCICDIDVLSTLPKEGIKNGLAEAIKCAIVADSAFFGLLETAIVRSWSIDAALLEKIVENCVEIKTGIVSRDESDEGERMKLNFGHTFGHAFEKTKGVSHGEAVADGMPAEAGISVDRGMLAKANADRIGKLLLELGFPAMCNINVSGCMDAIRRDKKRSGEGIMMALPTKIGNAKMVEVALEEIERALKRMNKG